eukprot:TRINITY_DN13827_c0_g1_i2.p1 TRINITY_DN13827_c0_g1~~TRINITY_DN13827_c0_g1_i2.p1  ORF type:complete len:455 (+),score=74.87 TRINITY_DN13827_c0_g1_i2:338-1702(+)
MPARIQLDSGDTDTSSSFATGAGLGLPMQSPEQAVPNLAKPGDDQICLHSYLAAEFDRAEHAAKVSDQVGAVSSLMCVDLSIVERQYQTWAEHMPRVRPYYAVKANPDVQIVQTLLECGAGFDCASAREIEMVRKAGADGETDVIFANCCKFPSDLSYAKSQKVCRMTVDNVDELKKIAQLHPDAQIVIRIVTDDSNSVCQLSNKYGASLSDVKQLVEVGIDLGLNLVGVSFHVGSGTSNPESFSEPIKNAAWVFKTCAEEYGITMNLLDIGGGFPGDDEGDIKFADIAKLVNQKIDEHFDKHQEIQIIAEPGRFFAHAAATLATRVIARRLISGEGCASGEEFSHPDKPAALYYLGDGVYGSFNCILFDHYTPPIPTVLDLAEPVRQSELVPSRVFGPTCDGLDTIFESVQLPLLSVGQLLLFKHMGAYTNAAASNFNGVSSPNVIYFRSLGH